MLSIGWCARRCVTNVQNRRDLWKIWRRNTVLRRCWERESNFGLLFNSGLAYRTVLISASDRRLCCRLNQIRLSLDIMPIIGYFRKAESGIWRKNSLNLASLWFWSCWSRFPTYGGMKTKCTKCRSLQEHFQNLPHMIALWRLRADLWTFFCRINGAFDVLLFLNVFW